MKSTKMNIRYYPNAEAKPHSVFTVIGETKLFRPDKMSSIFSLFEHYFRAGTRHGSCKG